MAKHIELTKGMVAVVDDDDFERLSQYSWHAARAPRAWYAARRVGSSRRVGSKMVLMHRMIIDVPLDMEVDHIDHDGLNNRKSNLRVATRSQNAANSRIRNDPRKTSRFKGVHRIKGDWWEALIKVDGELVNLGKFRSEVQAAEQYDRGARVFFGRFAMTNAAMGLIDKKIPAG